MKQQTAVEWLQQQYDNSPESFLTEEDFQTAKQMEKEQIKDAWVAGGLDKGDDIMYSNPEHSSAEDYYNQNHQEGRK